MAIGSTIIVVDYSEEGIIKSAAIAVSVTIPKPSTKPS